MADRTIDLLLRLSLDKTQQAQVKAGIKTVEMALAEAVEQSNKLRESMERVTQVGTRLATLGAAITAPLILSAKKYTDSVKDGEETSRKMLRVMERWEDVQIRIGRVTADTMLPALEKALTITEKIAAFAEKNPEAVKGTLITGAALTAVGGLAITTAQIVSTLATVKGLFAAGGINAVTGGGVSAATGGAGKLGTVALYASAVIIGAEVGLALGNAINRALGREEQTRGDVFTAAKQLSTILSPIGLAAQALKAAGFDEQASKIWEFSKAINGLGDSAEDAAQVTGESAEIIKRRYELQQQLTTEAVRYSEERIKIERDAAEKITDAERKFADQRLAIAQELAASLRKAEQDYKRERAEILRDSGIEIARIEQDSQRRVAQIRRNFARQENDAIRARDALGLVEAQRARDEEIDQERENTAVEIQRRREDIALRLRDLDSSYRRERADRIAAAQQKIRDLQENERREILQMRTHQQQVLRELQIAYNTQIALIRSTWGRVFSGNLAEQNEQRRYSNNAAENIIGARTAQEKQMNAMTMNVNLANGMTIMQAKRMMQASNQNMMRELSSAFGSL